MPIYRPRMLVRLYVPNVGTAQERMAQQGTDDVTMLQVRCHRARWESNNHNEADELEVYLSYDDAGVDPRILKSAEVHFYLGDGDEYGDFTPTNDNLRFLGIAVDVERELSATQKNVKIRALDYTTFFLEHKQFPAAGIPDFSMTLADAWALICDHTGYYDLASQQVVSTVQLLRSRLEFHGLDAPGPVLGQAVSARLAKLGKLHVKHDSDAWAVWQTCVGSVGLISYIRNDRCVVTTATDFYTADDPPRFVYGENILTIRESRNAHALSGKNVGLFSFDPTTMRTIEAYWPPIELAIKQKKNAAGALKGGAVVHAQDYEVFDYPGPVTDQATLLAIAKRVWEERSRQELLGEFHTAEMYTDTLGKQSFDVLALQAGDRVRIEIDQTALTLIQAMPSLSDREAALKARGYSPDMAAFLTKNLDSFIKLPPEFQVHSVTTELETTEEDGRYETTVHFLNRIDVSGAAQPGTGEANVPAVTGQHQTTDGAAERRRNGFERRGQ